MAIKKIKNIALIKKGTRKTSKAVFTVNNKQLTINHKAWNLYFSDETFTKRISDIITAHELNGGTKITGFIKCIGGGVNGQCDAICDAISRFIGVKVHTDTRRRIRNTPGKTGPNTQKPNNKR